MQLLADFPSFDRRRNLYRLESTQTTDISPGLRQSHVQWRPTAGGVVDPDYEMFDEGIGPTQFLVCLRCPHAVALHVTAHGLGEVRNYETES